MRGSTTPPVEQAYILRQSHSVGLVAQDAASLEKLLPHIAPAASVNGSSSNGNGSSSGAGNVNGSVTVRAAPPEALHSRGLPKLLDVCPPAELLDGVQHLSYQRRELKSWQGLHMHCSTP